MGTRGDFDRVAEALRHRTRRQILVELLEHNPVVYSDLLARHGLEDGVGGRVSEAKQTEISLVHNHLPMLDGMHYIDWNRDGEEIVKGSNWAEIETPLQVLNEHRDAMSVTWL